MYAVALARGHVFNDGNKRTALTSALTYLGDSGIKLGRTNYLEEVMVDVAQGLLNEAGFARHPHIDPSCGQASAERVSRDEA